MPALINALAAAGQTCPELEAWRRCEAHWDQDAALIDVLADCEKCALSGPERCEGQVIKALVRRLDDLHYL